MFTRLCNDNLTIMPGKRIPFRMAARFADQYVLRLRAGDALHLAICADQGAIICALDGRSPRRR
jgi:hypothetical protein